jgi:hypothetical protein
MPAPPVLLRRARPAVVLLATFALGFGASACTGERPELAEEAQTTTSETTTTEPSEPEPEVAEANEATIDVYASEDDTEPDRQIESGVDTSLDTIPIVFLVKDRDPEAERLEVYLPVAPNGSTGWVEAADVTVRTTPYRVEVQISEHRLRVLRGEVVIVDEPAGVGPSDRPTLGSYYLRELLEPPDPDGPFGPYTYGLSGSANVLESVEGAEGLLGIHGTDEPDTIGEDVENGSISLRNDVMARLVEEIGLPLGTPVDVAA